MFVCFLFLIFKEPNLYMQHIRYLKGALVALVRKIHLLDGSFFFYFSQPHLRLCHVIA